MSRPPLLLLFLALATPALASNDEEPPPELREVQAEPVPELPVVEAPLDPVRELLGQAANPTLPEELAQSRFNELVALGQSALPSLASVYRSSSSSELEVWVAARAMGRIGGEGAARTLVTGLESPDIVARLGSVSGLALLKDKETAPALEKALFDRAATVRASAADALAALGTRKSSLALSDALNIPANFKNGRSIFVRRHIVVALGEIGSIGGIDALVGVLDEEEEDLRLASIHSLTQITGMSFRPAGSGPDAPTSQAELQSWKNWWSNRRVGTTSD